VSLRYTITREDSVIRVRTEGVFDFISAYEMWEEIAATCNSQDCYRVLGVSNLDKPIATIDAYDHLEMLKSVGIDTRHRIAWVAGHPALLDNLLLAQTVVRNRSEINLRIFENMKPAELWLAES